MSVQIKKERLFEALKGAELFNIFNIDENDESVFLQAQQNISTGRCIISITLDNRVFNPVHYYLGSIDNPAKKEKMLDLMNEFNKEGLMVKYYLDEDGAIMARITYIVPNQHFDGKFLVELMISTFNIIADNHYPKLMRLIWS